MSKTNLFVDSVRLPFRSVALATACFAVHPYARRSLEPSSLVSHVVYKYSFKRKLMFLGQAQFLRRRRVCSTRPLLFFVSAVLIITHRHNLF